MLPHLLVRAGQSAVGRGGAAVRRGAHPRPLFQSCNLGCDPSSTSRAHHAQHATRAFHWTAVGAREWKDLQLESSKSPDGPPQRRRQRPFDTSSGRNDRRRDNNQRKHWRDGGRADPNRPRGDWQSYLSHLEQRATDHVRRFPSDISSALPATLASWHRTTVELIMLLSKSWGRGQRSDPRQLAALVSLADELLGNILLAKEEGYSGGERGGGRNQRGGKESLSTEVLCQSVALGWSRCDTKLVKDAAPKAQRILDRLEGMRTRGETTAKDAAPSSKLCNHVLSCWARSMDDRAVSQAQKLLERMSNSQGTLARPDTISYNNMLTLYANRGDVDAARKLLRRMERPNHQAPPDVYSYSILMNALQRRFTSSSAKDRDAKDLARAEEVLSQMTMRYEKSGFRDGTLRPSNVTFGTMISMYAQADRILKKDDQYWKKTRRWKAEVASDRENAAWGATNAERVLEWMIGLSDRERRSKESGDVPETPMQRDGAFHHGKEVIQPSAFHFVTVMDAYAKARKGVEGARQCEKLLRRLESLHEKHGYPELQPNPICYGAVIDAWAKADNEYATAEHAESYLDKMEELFLHRKSPNPKEMLSNVVYNLVIDAWSRRSGSDTPERAERVLRRLVDKYELTKSRLLRPDVITYTAVMKTHVKYPDGGRKALKLLDEMNAQYRVGNVKAQPDSMTLAVAMDACAKSGLTEEAERILWEVDDSKKTNVMFNTILAGYKTEGRGNEAEALLRKMVALSDEAGWKRCSPDGISYALCIEAWGNGKDPDRVSRSMALLDEAIEHHKKRDGPVSVDSVFIAAALCLAESDYPGRERRILDLFVKMEDIGCEPSVVSFNILIKACGKADGDAMAKMDALWIATTAFDSLAEAGLKADSITYVGMLHAMINLMDDTKEKVDTLQAFFRRCCDDGCLNEWILDILAGALPEEHQFSYVTGLSSKRGTPKLKSLPAGWRHRSSEDRARSEDRVYHR